MNATQTAKARENLINNQLKPWGGLNYKANNALTGIPRDKFVQEEYKNLAFSDINIPINETTTMFEPKVEGRILDALNITSDDAILEIGTGSGYLTACLAILGKYVTTIEIDEQLSNLAKQRLAKLNIDNVKFVVQDASKGIEKGEFFDVVLVGASVPKITGRYFHLVNVGGRIFVIEGVGKIMTAKLITRISEEEWHTQSLFETSINTMRGLEMPPEFNF
jgi:protein-L-isoaspartate(D-aspartate) O-methyltransferase